MSIRSLVLFFVFSASFCFAQYYPVYLHVFDADSLKGFNEPEARTSAIEQNYIGQELKRKMYQLKREFIKEKYQLVSSQPVIPYYPVAYKQSAAANCVNEDFEGTAAGVITTSNQISGWAIASGVNDPYLPTNPGQQGYNPYFPLGLPGVNSCNLIGCCPMPTAHSEIIDCSVGYIDPNIGSQYPIYSIFGTGTVIGSSITNTHIAGGLFGTKVLRLNDPLVGDYSVERLGKTFAVTTSNSMLQLAFISVTASGHACCDAGGLQVRFTDVFTNSVLACPSLSISSPSSLCSNSLAITFYNFGGSVYTPTNGFGNVYNEWKVCSFDLSAYIGKVFAMEVIATDCNAGGHFGYIYLDAQCGNMNITINGLNYAALNTPVNYFTCAGQATLKAPGNYNSYQWSGPGGISTTNSLLTTTVAGTYTLTMDQGIPCLQITKLVQVSFPAVSAGISGANAILCAGETSNLQATGMSSYTWSTGDNTQTISVAPLATADYSVTGLSTEGCPVSASVTLMVDACTGLASQLKSNSSFIYPNPNEGIFDLISNQETAKAELRIENAIGQLVHTQTVERGKNSVRTKDLPAGIYYYKIIDAKKRRLSSGKLKIE